MTVIKAGRLTLMTLAVLSLAPAAGARDIEVCANLYRRLNDTPKVIGNSGETRRYALELSSLNADIRSMRIEMRRQGCGGGSIVTFGNPNKQACGEMQNALGDLEGDRDRLTEERNDSRRQFQPSEERVAVLAALRENNCTPSDLGQQLQLETRERMKIQGIALPENEEGSSITRFGSPPRSAPKAEEKIEFPPERPYDPDRKVRLVGPRFFPENRIDLANPKVSGPQPQQ